MTTTMPVTAKQLLDLHPDGRCELVAGELRCLPFHDWRHGQTASRVLGVLGRYVRDHEIGLVLGGGTGFLLSRNPDTVSAPDVAFIARDNLPEKDPSEVFWPGARVPLPACPAVFFLTVL